MINDFDPKIHSDAPHVQICHYCNELKRFCGRVNFGNHYYCTGCVLKIGKLDVDYWKECSNIEFFNGMRKELRKFREMFSSQKHHAHPACGTCSYYFDHKDNIDSFALKV